MKISIIIVLLFCCLVSNILNKNKKKSKSKSKSKYTPKGIDLRNHFGTPNIANQYGPQDDTIANYVGANHDSFVPTYYSKKLENWRHRNDYEHYNGMEDKLNPSPVKSGEYTNVAKSATKEIKPEITGPKLQVEGEFSYPAAVKTPTFYGFAKEYHPVYAYDKYTGEIIQEDVLIDRPVYNYENRVANIHKQFSQTYDMRTGKKLTKNPNLKKHGVNQVADD